MGNNEKNGARTKHIYSNCIMLDQQNEIIFRCSDERANWYIKRDLAEIVSDSPLTMRLKFVPGGKGNAGDIFYCGQKENKCVVCGDEDLVELTKHHVVPYWLRRHFPIEYSNHTSHDILPVCRLCHDKYEIDVQQVMKSIMDNDEELSEEMKKRKEYVQKFSIASVLVRMGDTIPRDRQEDILRSLTEFVGTSVTRSNLSDVILELEQKVIDFDRSIGSGVIGKRIVDKLPDIDAFVIFWRKHFVDTMQPKFLPDGWHIDHKTTRTR